MVVLKNVYFGFLLMKDQHDHTNRNFGLDVCRCLAVSMVLFAHSGQNIFKTPFPFLWYLPIGGVELFFSLSGFLIGRILLGLFDSQSVSLRDIVVFWTKRWLRTLPLYYVLYFVYLVLYSQLFYPVSFDARYLLFLHNFTTPPLAFFGESSTLSIEEWFYFTAPLLIYIVLFLAKQFKKPFLSGTQAYIIGAVALIMFSVLMRGQYMNTGRFIAVTVIFRMDAIAYGLLMAYYSRGIARMTNRRATSVIAAGTVLWFIAAIIRLKYFDGLAEQCYYLFSGFGTALVVLGFHYFSFRKHPRAIPYISKLSYSIYLVHLTGVIIPLLYFFPRKDGVDRWLVLLLVLVLTFLLASLTYYFIERPFLRLRALWFPKNKKNVVINLRNEASRESTGISSF